MTRFIQLDIMHSLLHIEAKVFAMSPQLISTLIVQKPLRRAFRIKSNLYTSLKNIVKLCFVKRRCACPPGAETQNASDISCRIDTISFLDKLKDRVIQSETPVNERIAAVL
jgi:hypothetical protein